MSAERIVEKIKTISETAFDTPYFRDINRIQKCLNSCTDLFEMESSKWKIVPLNAPKYVMNNMERYQAFIRPVEV